MLDPGRVDALNHKCHKPSTGDVKLDVYIYIYTHIKLLIYTHVPCELEIVFKACFFLTLVVCLGEGGFWPVRSQGIRVDELDGKASALLDV